MLPVSAGPNFDWAATLNRLPLLEIARWFHAEGGNVFPLKHGTKNGFPYPWGRLTYTRLPAEALPHIFAGPANLAVMMGASSQNLFVLDCETSAAFRTGIVELERREVPICAVQTARGGHLYLRAEGVVSSIVSGMIPNVEVRGTGGYVLLPPSLHPTGVLYRFHRWEQSSPPLVDIQQIDFLTDTNGQQIHLQMRCSHIAHPVSLYSRVTARTRDYLGQGGNLAEGSRNVRLFSAATDLLGCGADSDQAKTLLFPVASRSGLSPVEIEHTLRNASSKIRQPHKVLSLSRSSSTEVAPSRQSHQEIPHPRVQALWAFAMHAPVTAGRKGDSERRLLLAMVALYQRGAKAHGVFRGSQREWLELAHLSDHHASEKALHRLQQSSTEQPPILQTCGVDKLSGARLWQIAAWVFEAGKQLLRETTAREASVKEDNRLRVDTLNNADYLERGALGVNGYRIYEILCEAEQPISLKQIAEGAQLTVDTVRYHLREERPLRQQALVQIHGARRNRTYSAAPVSHEELNICVAAACLTAGKSEARSRKHERERGWFMAGLIVRRMEHIWTSSHRLSCLPRSTRVIDALKTELPTAPPI